MLKIHFILRMTSCAANWLILFQLVMPIRAQIPEHLLTGINELYHGGAYAYFNVSKLFMCIKNE